MKLLCRQSAVLQNQCNLLLLLSCLQIGKVEEIFGGIQNAYFTVKMSEGVIATSYAAGDKFFIDPAKLLPLERFLPQPKGAASRGGGRGSFPVAPYSCPQASLSSCIGERSLPRRIASAAGVSRL